MCVCVCTALKLLFFVPFQHSVSAVGEYVFFLIMVANRLQMLQRKHSGSHLAHAEHTDCKIISIINNPNSGFRNVHSRSNNFQRHSFILLQHSWP